MRALESLASWTLRGCTPGRKVGQIRLLGLEYYGDLGEIGTSPNLPISSTLCSWLPISSSASWTELWRGLRFDAPRPIAGSIKHPGIRISSTRSKPTRPSAVVDPSSDVARLSAIAATVVKPAPSATSGHGIGACWQIDGIHVADGDGPPLHLPGTASAADAAG